MFGGLVCAIFHKRHHRVLERGGDWSRNVCLKCYRAGAHFRPFEPEYLARQEPLSPREVFALWSRLENDGKARP